MLLISVGRIFQFTLLLLTIKLATSLLSPADVGKISLVTAATAFFSLLMINPIGMFWNRRLHAWNDNGKIISYLICFMFYLFSVSFFTIVVLLGFIEFDVWRPNINTYWLLALVCGSLVFGTLNQVIIPSLNLLDYKGWFSILTVSTAIVSLVFAVLFVNRFSMLAEYWISGLLVGQLLVGLVGLKIFINKIQDQNKRFMFLPKPSNLQIRTLLMFCWPVAIAVGLGWVQSQGYRIIMEQKIGLNELGLFVAGYGISAGLIVGFDSIISTYFQPRFYKQINCENTKAQSNAWNEYAQAVMPSLILTSILVIAVAPELTVILLGASFRESSQFVIWGSLVELARVLMGIFALAAHARRNTKMLLFPNMIGAIMSVSLIWYFIQDYGVHGVGFSLVFSYLISLFFTVHITQQSLPILLPYKLIIRCLIMGGGLYITALILRGELWLDGGYFFSILIIAIVGIIFLLLQYLILRPILQREATVHK